MYCLGEMASAAGANTPIICLLWNNRSFAEIRHCMVAAQVEPTGVELYSPDFLRLSESMGWSAAHAETLDALPELLHGAAKRSTPTLIEITPRTFGEEE